MNTEKFSMYFIELNDKYKLIMAGEQVGFCVIDEHLSINIYF